MKLPNFKFYLKFVSLEHTELYETCEFVGFDAANFVVLQNQSRFSRDISYCSDNIDLRFIDGDFALGDNKQIKSPKGNISKYLDMGIYWIFESRKKKGFEAEIEFHIFKNDYFFTLGILDMVKGKTDGETYFSCPIIQKGSVANYKRHLEDTINLFGTKNYLNEVITPAPTMEFLRKAVPISQYSKFITPQNFILNGAAMYGNDQFIINPALQIMEYGAENTYTPNGSYDYMNNTTNENLNALIPNRLIYKAKRRTNNFRIKLSDLNFFLQPSVGIPYPVSINVRLFWGNPDVFPLSSGNAQNHIFFSSGAIVGGVGVTETINDEYTIPFLEIGQSVWFYINIVCQGVPSPTPVNSIYFSIDNTFKIELFTTETALDTVVKGVRYFDAIKQTSKYVDNLPIEAPRFDIGGEFYDQVVWNRSLITGNTNNTFNTSLKEMMGSVEEVCADYEFLDDKIFIGQYDQFHVNQEIGALLINPSKEFEDNFADEAQLSTFKFGYETYEQNRDTKNTREDMHTDSEWGILNEKVEKKKEIKCKLVRSAYSQQVAVDLEVAKSDVSDVNDDKVYINDIIPLSPGSFAQFGIPLNQRLFNGKLQISNRDLNTEIDSVILDWSTQGLSIGQQFNIITGANVGTYTVFAIEKTILTLTPVAASPSVFGDVYSEFKFFYTNILWKTRGNEGFTAIDGLSNTTTYPNLRYSIRRNMKHWESYINRSCQFIGDKLVVVNRYFKNNTTVKTNYNNEGILTEKGDILIANMPAPLMTPKTYSLELVANFQEMLSILDNMKTIRGFIRCYSNNGRVLKGFIKKLDYTWRTGELKLTIDEKFESEILTLVYANDTLTVNDVTYNVSKISKWWRTNDVYFQFLDIKSKPINNYIDFNLISLNGVIYSSQFALVEALNNL